MKTILSEAIKCNQEEKHLAVTLEFARWELADAEKELKLLKSSVSSSEKEYDQIQKDTEAIEMELESERYFSFQGGWLCIKSGSGIDFQKKFLHCHYLQIQF